MNVFAALTGLGLSTSAGLNAYIPMLCVALLSRYTHLITLPASWSWLHSGWMILALAVLLAIDFVADKVPAVDHVNDVIQTVVRPTSGGLVFGATSSEQSATVSDPHSFMSGHTWIPVVVGALVALVVHVCKAISRVVINAATVGFGAPVASTVEEVFSLVMSLVAIILPFLVVIFMVGLALVFVLMLRRWRRRRREKQLRRLAEARFRPGVL
jgi:Domain of unknown function (DUF4126)